MGTTDWNQRYFRLARHVAEWSRDPSTKVGCVIVSPSNEIRSVGYNGFPRNVEDASHRLARPEKYSWIEHAERNAIYAAARAGVPLEGCKMYTDWFPCVECARAIVQVGIKELFCREPNWTDTQWGESFRTSRTMLEEAAILVRFVGEPNHITDPEP
jgi:dCMP deaminase